MEAKGVRRVLIGSLLIIVALFAVIYCVYTAPSYSSDQWFVKLYRPPGRLWRYDLVVKNKGEEVSDVTIELYSDEPNGTKVRIVDPTVSERITKGELSSISFPTYGRVSRLEVEISWRKKDSQNQTEKLKESFVFE